MFISYRGITRGAIQVRMEQNAVGLEKRKCACTCVCLSVCVCVNEREMIENAQSACLSVGRVSLGVIKGAEQ